MKNKIFSPIKEARQYSYPGEMVFIGGDLYIVVNTGGTLEKKWSYQKWYKVIALAFLHFIGKKRSYQ